MGPRPLGAVLTEVLASIGLAPDTPEAILRSRWVEAAGADVAAVTGIEGLRNGRLTLLTDSNYALMELSLGSEGLRKRINAFLGGDGIREVRVKMRRFHAA